MRDSKILEELKNCDGYLNLDSLSKQMNVSKRTIQTDIKTLNISSHHHGYKISNLRGKGYYIEIDDAEKFDCYLKSLQSMDVNYKADRIPGIIAILLLKNDYVSQEWIAEFLNVSKSIIKTDMDQVDEIFKSKNIDLQRKAHYGIQLHIDNFNRKLEILELYEQKNELICEALNFADEKFQEVEKQLIQLLAENELSANYTELKKIDSFIKICIYANIHKLNVAASSAKQDGLYENLVKRLNKTIDEQYHISFDQNEINDLALYIMYKTKRKKNIEYPKGLEDMVMAFFKECDQKYNSKFMEDAEFQLSLLSHVSLLLDRLHQSISFTNPLVDEISVKYPVNMNMAIQFAQKLEKAYNVSISQDEIGFIATHFAAHMERQARNLLGRFNRIAIVCSSGGGSAFLIKLKMERLFVGKDVQTFSLFQEDALMEYHPDVIFTIADLYHKFDVPIIKIKELLDDNDILKIRNMFNLGIQNVIENIGKLASLMRKDCFFVFEEDMKYEDILKTMAKNVETLDLVHGDYVQNVLMRESYVSTIYKNGIAIPHPLNNCAKENVISVGIVKSKNSTAKIVFLANLKTGSIHLLQEITRILFEVMESEDSVNFLKEANSFEDFTMRLYTLDKK